MLHLLKNSVSKADIGIWLVTIGFFLGSSLLLGGNHGNSLLGALGIITLMFGVGLSIEFILGALRGIKGLGEVTGFITNGPEALVLIVGLISGNIIFAASTPLGSNVVNPLLLLLAFLILGYQSVRLFKEFKYKLFYLLGFLITAGIASSFFLFSEQLYIVWFLLAMTGSLILYFMNKKITKKEEIIHDEEPAEPKYYLVIGILLLLVCGYFLDPVVNFTAEASQAPKGLIGFLVLSTLTSWPEFKSCVALLKKGRTLDAFVNILISNFANIWLASIGLLVFWMTK